MGIYVMDCPFAAVLSYGTCSLQLFYMRIVWETIEACLAFQNRLRLDEKPQLHFFAHRVSLERW